MSGFAIIFDAPTNLAPRSVGPFDEVDDNIVSLIASVCEELESEPGVRFEISGFGEDPWPTDVQTDFAIVVEQLPDLVAALSNGKEGALDLFEQGMQRLLRFEPEGEAVRITCQSLTTWQPDPATVTVPVGSLITMLKTLLQRFVALVQQAFPSVANHRWFAEWLGRAPATGQAI